MKYCFLVKITGALAGAVILSATPVLAHGFGQRYDLPAPLWMYLSGAGAAVGLSFVVMAISLRENASASMSPTFKLSATFVGRWLSHPALLTLMQLISVTIFLLVLATGFFGVQNPLKNFAPTMVWVIWWIGLAFVSALLGDLWAVINPWRALFKWGSALIPDGVQTPPKPYPQRLGAWPGVALFVAFAWLELVSEVGDAPRQMANLIVIYSILTWWGMAIYGCEQWRTHGEAFTVAFSLFARFAPTGAGPNRTWILRPPAIGLLTEKPIHPSITVFVLLILSTVTFDGFLDTPAWLSILERIAEDSTLRPLLLTLQKSGINLLKTIKTVALVAFPMCFFVAYLFVCWLMARMDGTIPVRRVVGCFGLSLVPIAIAYHIAHYLSYFALAGQQIIALISDPFGVGWDLFGTAN